jgi:hypothetical protein
MAALPWCYSYEPMMRRVLPLRKQASASVLGVECVVERTPGWGHEIMIPKSGNQFSDKIVLK